VVEERERSNRRIKIAYFTLKSYETYYVDKKSIMWLSSMLSFTTVLLLTIQIYGKFKDHVVVVRFSINIFPTTDHSFMI
jgi:hypothetical protein